MAAELAPQRRVLLLEIEDTHWEFERTLVCRWHRIALQGPGRLSARCYPGVAYAPQRGLIYVAGGIGADRASLWGMQSIDPQHWTVQPRVETSGWRPRRRG